MVLLVWILIFLSRCKADTSQTQFVYKTTGQDVVVQGSTTNGCPTIWTFYKTRHSGSTTEFPCETPQRESLQSDRIRLDRNCGFVINKLTTEDAGLYFCQRPGGHNRKVYLSVLDVSPENPGADPQTDDEVTLRCSLSTYSEFPPCETNSLRWLDGAGTVLLDKGVGYEFLRQMNCVTYLKVQRQRGHNRKYTCQLVDQENRVEIQADYTHKFTRDSGTQEQNNSHQEQNYTVLAVAVGAAVLLLLLLLIVAIVLVTYKTRRKAAADAQETAQQPDDTDSHLTYATVSHKSSHGASPKTKVNEEEQVIYSPVKNTVKTSADGDQSSLYCDISVQNWS